MHDGGRWQVVDAVSASVVMLTEEVGDAVCQLSELALATEEQDLVQGCCE